MTGRELAHQLRCVFLYDNPTEVKKKVINKYPNCFSHKNKIKKQEITIRGEIKHRTRWKERELLLETFRIINLSTLMKLIFKRDLGKNMLSVCARLREECRKKISPFHCQMRTSYAATRQSKIIADKKRNSKDSFDFFVGRSSFLFATNLKISSTT